ncbi:hypothetical protein [Streptomyces sp. NRRL F-5126]|uniref:hypothetical protein n=1 Tax=Streptomyces sp. NRRL F-5126 TaxID=1463857 RepID=UPI0004C618D2|nr:hypothetical protein [Streptomyces sp. NRRL F-5126]
MRIYTPEGRSFDEDVIELQFFEDGGLRLLMTRLSDANSRTYQSPDEAKQVIFDSAAVLFTRHMLELIRLISQDVGYHGNWAVAVGANRLRGRRRWSQSMFAGYHRYSADTYEESTGTPMAALRDAPGTVTRRLLGPLLRSLDFEEAFESVLARRGVTLTAP